MRRFSVCSGYELKYESSKMLSLADRMWVIVSVMVLLVLSLPCWGDEIDPNDIDWGEAENMALGKPARINMDNPKVVAWLIWPGHDDPKNITDGDRQTDLWAGGGETLMENWGEVDLGEVMWIDAIRVWHYYADGRIYTEVRTAVSTTGKFEGEEKVIFGVDKDVKSSSWTGDVMDNKSVKFEPFDGIEYAELLGGRVTLLDEPVQARYIRDWCDKPTLGGGSHWAEIEVYSLQGSGSAVIISGKLPFVWGSIKARP